MEQTNGYKLDKHHYFHVTMFDGFEKAARTHDIYTPPPLKEYTPSVRTRRGARGDTGVEKRMGGGVEAGCVEVKAGGFSGC